MSREEVEARTTPYEASYVLFHALHGGNFQVSQTALFDDRGMLETWLVPRSRSRLKGKPREGMAKPQVLRRHADKVNLLLLLSEWVEMQKAKSLEPVALVIAKQGTYVVDQRSFKSQILELGKHEARVRFDVYEASDNVFPGPMVMVSWTQPPGRVVYVSKLELGDESCPVRIQSSVRTVQQMFAGSTTAASDSLSEEKVERSVATVLRNCVIDMFNYLRSRRNMNLLSLHVWHWIDPMTNAAVLLGCSELTWTQIEKSITESNSSSPTIARTPRNCTRANNDMRSFTQTQNRIRPSSARPSSAYSRRQSKQPFVPSSSFPSELTQKSKSLTPDDEILALRDKQKLRKTKHLLFEERQLTSKLRSEILTLKAATKQDETRLLRSSSETSDLTRRNRALSKEIDTLRRRDSQRVDELKRLEDRVSMLERSLEEEACELHDAKTALGVTKEELSDTREELVRTVSAYRSATASAHQEKDRLVEKGMLLQKQLDDTVEGLQETRETLDQLEEFHRLCWTVLVDVNTPGVDLPRKGGKRRRKGKGKTKGEQEKVYPVPNRKNVQIVVKALVDDVDNRNAYRTNKPASRKYLGPFGRLTRMASTRYKVEDSTM